MYVGYNYYTLFIIYDLIATAVIDSLVKVNSF